MLLLHLEPYTSICSINLTCFCVGGIEEPHAVASRLQPSDTTALPDEAMSPLSRPKSARPQSPGGPRFGGLQTTGPEGGQRWGIIDGIVQFDGEREMWASYQDSDLRTKRRLRAVVAGALLLVRSSLDFSTGPQVHTAWLQMAQVYLTNQCVHTHSISVGMMWFHLPMPQTKDYPVIFCLAPKTGHQYHHPMSHRPIAITGKAAGCLCTGTGAVLRLLIHRHSCISHVQLDIDTPHIG